MNNLLTDMLRTKPLFLFCVICIFFAKPSNASKAFVLKGGFIFHDNNIANEVIYKESVLHLYYYIEQNLSVSPKLRKFCTGNQRLLLRLEFDSTGTLVFIAPVERYFWYNIDAKARAVVSDLIVLLSESDQWTKQFTGEVFLPLQFQVGYTGRIIINYNSFYRGQNRVVRIGDN